MQPNVNPETGIRYGIISAHSLEDWVLEEIGMNGKDLDYEEWKEDFVDAMHSALSEYLSSSNIELLSERALDLVAENYCNNEPRYSYELDGVKVQTTWLGGAMLVYVFESPVIGHHALCSPCVPNCGDLNNDGEYECYDVPADWRRSE